MKKHRNIPDSSIIPIVNTGAIGTNDIGEGRMVPVIIIDCSEKLELRDLIYAHEDTLIGDVLVTWALPKRGKSKILLILEFTLPSKLEVGLQFDIEKQSVIVDGIFQANAIYLQPLESGSGVMDGLDNVKILVEIPDTGFFPTWDKLYSKSLIKIFKKSGFSRKEANKAAEQHKIKLREIWSRRMK